MTVNAPESQNILPTQPPLVAAPDAERFVTYRSLLPWLGGCLIALTAIGGTLTSWVLNSARSEAQIPLVQVAAAKKAQEDATSATKEQLGRLAAQVEALSQKADRDNTVLREEVRRTEQSVTQESRATNNKLDDILILIATGKVRVPPPKRPVANSEPGIPTAIALPSGP
jgi:hypothetical protein